MRRLRRPRTRSLGSRPRSEIAAEATVYSSRARVSRERPASPLTWPLRRRWDTGSASWVVSASDLSRVSAPEEFVALLKERMTELRTRQTYHSI